MNTTEEFDRTKGIGGSDIPVLLGLSKWKTALVLYLEKIGDIKEAYSDEKSDHVLEMGKMLEPYVIEEFEKETGEKIVRRQERIYHPKYDFLWATIDGMYKNSVFEVKTTSSLVRAWNDGIPPYVLAQVAYYCNLLNSDGAKITVLFRDTGELRTYDYERNIEKEEEIINYAVDFWINNVCKKIPPAVFNYAEAQLLFKEVVPDKKVMASWEEMDAIEKMVQLKNEIKTKEAEFENLKTRVCVKIGDASMIEDSLGECLATWKARNNSRLSTEVLKKKYPNIYNECLVKSTIRVFNLQTRGLEQ